MLATRQVLGNMSRSRALAGAASGFRRMATVSDSPLDKKVSLKPIALLSLDSMTRGFITSSLHYHPDASPLGAWAVSAANPPAMPRLELRYW